MEYTSDRLSTAPMLDWSDRHCRIFWRLLTRRTMLYTEMVSTGAILHGREDFLAFREEELPLTLQLGGSSPEELALCCRRASEQGYSAINLNLGCPSDRVQNGGFGAALMLDIPLATECFRAMAAASSVPVTVKCRIGVDHQDSYEFLRGFVETLRSAGCRHFIIHARKAWLSGLSPKENREIPPLDYQRVYRIKEEFPDLFITINGGIRDLDETLNHLNNTDGVMLGRAAYQNPFLLHQADSRIFGEQSDPVSDRDQVVDLLLPYAREITSQGIKLSALTRHILDLYTGIPGARIFRRILSQEATRKDASADLLLKARDAVHESIRRAEAGLPDREG